MQPQTFVFIGRSGCGKGTQVGLLKKFLAQKDPATEIMYLETGNNFRDLISGNSLSSHLAKEISQKGLLQPDFIAISFWANFLMNYLKGDEHLFFDGICRSLPEAMSFTSAMTFYNRKVHVIHINVSRAWSKKRLLARGRADDKSVEEIEHRLDWFDKDTTPALEYFNMHERYTLYDINGEQSIEDVHKEILEKLKWLREA